MGDSEAPTSGLPASTTEGGTTGTHPQFAQTAVVAPSLPDETTFNTIRPGLITVACWRLDDIRFEFDSSFVLPGAAVEFTRLAELREQWKQNPVSLFGHADPVGNDTYNKALSGRRVRAIYGVLTRETAIWEKLHNEPFGGDVWGLKSAQHIMTALGFYAGPIDGKSNKATVDALKNFSADAGPPANGSDSPGTRKKLYESYFDFLSRDAEGRRFTLTKPEFLGRGADPDGKGGDYQACSEFNPVLLLPTQKEKEMTKEERNSANAPSRRVVAFFFVVEDHEIAPSAWPCPTWKEGTAKCKKRFWSDHVRRLEPAEEQTREYKETRDTMACRFYDRFARRSPCEAGFKEWVLRIFVPKNPELKETRDLSPTDSADEPGSEVDNTTVSPFKDRRPLTGTEFVVSGSGGPDVRGFTDANGFLRVRVAADATDMTLKIAGHIITLRGGQLPELDDPAVGDTDSVRERLFNMAYGPANRKDWNDAAVKAAVRKFRKDFDLPPGDAVDDAMKEKLREIHGC